jgi:alkanesulfonate monooxygenase SsuD/methylene tetrahydromethanopterin reductase-like flavin-dependent oxidoreductase (luciferase family)
LMAAYRKRTGKDPAGRFVTGDAAAILDRIGDYVAAGLSKFILRPLGEGDAEVLEQSRRLVEEVLPEVARRWPKPGR